MEYTKDDTIFVQIASYRDPELQHTLQDLYAKAKRPENIFVGICHQYDMKEDEDKHLFEVPFPRPEQLRIDEVDCRESQGCCWARNKVQKLYNGEKWTLMIDSHMRFEKNWDEILVENIKKFDNDRVAFTAYVPGYELNENREETINTNIGSVKLLFDGDIVRCNGGNDLCKISASAGISAHFLFANAKKFIEEIEYDSKIFFLGEEPTIAARLFTNGWTLYYLNKLVAYHLYNTGEKKQKRPINNNNKNNSISYKRVRQIFNMGKTTDTEALENIDKYSLGGKRTLRDYERFSGIDFRKKTTREHTKIGLHEAWNDTVKINEVKKYFEKSSRHNNKIHICFFINSEHTFDKWFAVNSIFEACQKDEDFKVSILKEDNNISETYDKFISNLDKDINVYTYYNNNSYLNLDNLNIDVILTFNPYHQQHMDWDKWKEKIPIALKPYGVYCDRSIEKNHDGDFKKMKIFDQSKYIFCESWYMKEALEEYWGNNNKFILSGSPNFDYILKDKKDVNQNLWRLDRGKNQNVKRIVWSPHYSIKRSWVFGLKCDDCGQDLENGFSKTKEGYSQFTKYADLFLKIPKLYPNLDIIMKPHPGLFKNLNYQTDGEWDQRRIDEWKRNFLDNPNTQIMENGLYDDLFLTSDAIINDSISFTVEYLPTLKPFLLCENLNGPGYNDWGNEIIKSYYRAHNEKDILNFLDEVVISGNDPMVDARKKAFEENIFIPKGGSGNFIKDYLENDILLKKNKKFNTETIKNIYKQKYKSE